MFLNTKTGSPNVQGKWGRVIRGLLVRGRIDVASKILNQSKVTFAAAFLGHDLGGGDGSVDGKLLTELLVVNRVVQVLDVQVDALVPGKI